MVARESSIAIKYFRENKLLSYVSSIHDVNVEFRILDKFSVIINVQKMYFF